MGEHDLADPLGMLRQEEFEGVKLLRNTLDVIKTVNADNDLDVTETVLELLDSFLDTILLKVLLDVNPCQIRSSYDRKKQKKHLRR